MTLRSETSTSLDKRYVHVIPMVKTTITTHISIQCASQFVSNESNWLSKAIYGYIVLITFLRYKVRCSHMGVQKNLDVEQVNPI